MTDKEPTNTRPTRFAGKLNHFEKKQNLTINEPTKSVAKAVKSPVESRKTDKPIQPITSDKKKLGKRNNSQYQQISAYLKKETYIALKKAVFEAEEDMSEVLEKLVSQWIKNK